MNAPQTLEGWQVWDLALRLGGQLRAASDAMLGFDAGAAMALAQALGVPAQAAAEMLPEIEAIAVRKINEGMKNRPW